jgi:hypothetical protein
MVELSCGCETNAGNFILLRLAMYTVMKQTRCTFHITPQNMSQNISIWKNILGRKSWQALQESRHSNQHPMFYCQNFQFRRFSLNNCCSYAENEIFFVASHK